MAMDVQNLLIFLVFVSGAVTEFVEQMKKQIMLTVFKGAETLTPEQQALYEALLLITRVVAAAIGIIILGGYDTLVGLLPFFAKLPQFGAVAVAVLLVGLGSDAIHMLLEFVKSLGGWFSTNTPATAASKKVN